MLQYDILPVDVVETDGIDQAIMAGLSGDLPQAEQQTLEALLDRIRSENLGDDAVLDLLADCLERTVRARSLATELGQATVAEIDFSAVVSMAIEYSARLAGADHAALCLCDAPFERVRQYGDDNGSITARELPQANVELLVEAEQGASIPLLHDAVCAGCLVQADVGHCLSLPLEVNEQRLGALCVMRDAGRAPFGRAAVAAGEHYAGWVAVALANANKIRAARDLARAERETMVAHLHDNVAQTLSLLNMRVEGVEDALGDQASPEVLARLNAVKSAVHEVFGQVRMALSDFRTPAAPPAKDLITALTVCAEAFQETAGIPVEFVVAGKCMLPEAVQVQAMNIVREALVNIRRHAQASHVLLELVSTKHEVRITVQDNGVGFTVAPATDGHHLGLTIMHERARRSGARLTIDSVPGCGTKVSLTYQISASDAATNGHGL